MITRTNKYASKVEVYGEAKIADKSGSDLVTS